MTETKKMRAILRERGIEYRDVNSMVTDIEHDGIKTRVYDYDDGPDYQLCVEQKWLTAEEAVRVALGIKPQEVLERRIDELCAEVERLKEREQSLVTLLRNDCDIEASWDGLRRFWSIGLTEDGCLMRDRACKAEAESAKLREYAAKAWSLFIRHGAVHACDLSEVDAVRDGLRELGIEVD